jgi:hypothetical protein
MDKKPDEKELDDDLATDDETADQVIGGLKRGEHPRPEHVKGP